MKRKSYLHTSVPVPIALLSIFVMLNYLSFGYVFPFLLQILDQDPQFAMRILAINRNLIYTDPDPKYW
jgi:hypothetical protein